MADIGRGFDIDGFRSVMARKGIARPNLYKLQITPPPGLKNAYRALNIPSAPADVEDIMLYCDSVTLPGLSLATTDSRPYGYGPTELKAYSPVFNTLSVSFIIDAKSFTLSFFRNWMRGIVNYTSEGKAYHTGAVNRATPFEASYKHEYETMMQLYVVSGQVQSSSETSLDLEIVSKTTIVRAFPISIGDIQMSYSTQDQYMTLPVTFSYFEWYADSLTTTAGALNNSPNVTGGGNNNGELISPSTQTTTTNQTPTTQFGR